MTAGVMEGVMETAADMHSNYANSRHMGSVSLGGATVFVHHEITPNIQPSFFPPKILTARQLPTAPTSHPQREK